MQHLFYVYTHTRLDNNQVFYVGAAKVSPPQRIRGERTKYERAYAKVKSRTEEWKEIIYKTSYRVDIVFESMNIEEIKTKELELISKHGRKGYDLCGTLVNKDLASFGKVISMSSRAKSLAINQIDPKTNKIVKVWKNPKEASSAGFSKTNIVACCRKRALTAFGFKWEYRYNRSFDNIYPTTARIKNTNRCRGIIITENLTGNYRTFRTIQEASIFTKLHSSTILKHLHKKNKNKYFSIRYRGLNEVPLTQEISDVKEGLKKEFKKVSLDEIEKIKKLKGKLSTRKVGKLFDISASTVSKIFKNDY